MTSVRGASEAGPGRSMTVPSPSLPAKSPDLSGVLEVREHALVLREHDIPAIVPPDVLAAAAAHRGAQRTVAEQQFQTLHEFIAIGVVQPAVAADAVLDEYLA